MAHIPQRSYIVILKSNSFLKVVRAMCQLQDTKHAKMGTIYNSLQMLSITVLKRYKWPSINCSSTPWEQKMTLQEDRCERFQKMK